MTDWSMPLMSGDELAREIKKRAKTPVLMITGFQISSDGLDDDGAIDHVINKPVTLDSLREAIELVTPPAA